MGIIVNRQLFSHTYLAQLQANPSHDAAAVTIFKGLHDWLPYRHMDSFQETVESWVGPALDFLDFRHVPATDDLHIHLLLAKRGGGPIGLCYIVAPEQSLDETAKGRHPMAQAALAARARGLRWVILTNGMLWRLLDAQSLGRYEHHLQVDLDQLARKGDPAALRLLYACFHRNAFAPDSRGETGLDRLAAASDQATKSAEDHLKSRASHNEGIMAQLCLGLVRANGRTSYTEEERDAIYRDATYLLYRMLFILYAEARNLLPLDHSGYKAVSLNQLAQTAYAYKLHGMSDPQATTLWTRLKRLCTAIYESEESLSIPAYNGGLFDDADKPYLQQGAIADTYLTEALFALTYQPDTRGTDGYRSIDYRDLSVRHLGSLYEGMIEYRLQIAEETLWARRDDKGNIRFLSTDQVGAPRKTDVEIKPGQVYFSQSPGERRATGTYYTPEYIVDYIVEQTTVRGLEERRAPLREKLAGWQQEIAMTADPDERVRMQCSADEELLHFVETQVLTFRVCDPAMGSGHFLVNTAHQIAAFIVETLHETPWENPMLSTDPVAWRRRVVARCLYGVDLSHMAVELAKLSLWLASVAVGKPLSFLQHHLRQGNSLIGITLQDLATELADTDPYTMSRRERKERAAGQQSMYDDRAFRQHLVTAADLLEQISSHVAETVSDVKAQESDYERVREELSPYCQVANLLVARQFGLEVDGQRLRAITRQVTAESPSLPPEQQELLAQAQMQAEEQSFFHWDIEFPRVFLAQANNGGKAGFDAIVGNPPYVRQERISEHKAFFQTAFDDVYSGGADLYVYFIAQGVRRLAAGGRLGMITANKWLRADYAASLRVALPRQTQPIQLLDFGHSDIFPGTDTFPCILILREPDGRTAEPLLFADVSDHVRGNVPLPAYVPSHAFQIPTSNLKRSGWVLEPGGVSDLLEKLDAEYPKLGEQVGMDALRGIITGYNNAFYIDTATRDRMVEQDPDSALLLRRLLRGRTVRRWTPSWDGTWMIAIPSSGNRIWPWSHHQDEHKAEESFRRTYPALHGHLKPFERALRRRQDKGRFWWELRACNYYDHLDQPKIVVQQILYHSVFALDAEKHWVNQLVYLLPTDDLYILAILNSRVTWWYLYRTWPHMKDEALSVHKPRLLEVPVPAVSEPLRTRVEALVRQAITLAGEVGPELLAVERRIHECVVAAYGLSAAEVDIIERTLPPRDPLVVLEKRLAQND